MAFKPYLKYVLIGILIVIGLIYAFTPTPVEVDTDSVTHRDLTIEVSEDGRTRVRQRYTMYAPLSGRLLRVPWRPGDSVEKGTSIIARIVPLAPNLLDTRAKAESTARVKTAEAEKERRQAELQRAIRAHRFAGQQKKRKQELFGKQFISQEELDSAALEVNLRAAELRAAREAVQVALFELQVAQAAKLTESRDQSEAGEAFELQAVVSGKVLKVMRESGGFIQAGAPLLEIADATNLEFVVDLLSTEAVKVRPGARARIDHWGGDHQLEARVRLIEPSGFTKISALGVEEQRVNVILDLISPAEHWQTLGDGYRAEIHIEIWKGLEELTVPNEALFWSANQWHVFKIEESRAQLTPIDIGRRNQNFSVVRAGLTPGDRVVIHPSDTISDGTKLKLNQEQHP